METTGEQWKDIPGYEGYYQVSTHGRVKALARVVQKRIKAPHTQGSSPVQPWAERILKGTMNTNGYPRVMLRRNAQAKTFSIHRLVLVTWVGEPQPGQQACHNDGDRANNHVTNLRWDTSKNNHADKKRHGTQQCGEKHPNAKLTDDQVLAILADPRGPAAIARDYQVTTQAVSQIRLRKSRNIFTHMAKLP